MKFLLRTLLILIPFLFFGHKTVSKDSINVLFVGNSFTYFYNLPLVLNEMSEYSDNYYINTKHSLIGGSTISDHLDKSKSETINLIENESFDFVILNHHSLATLDESKFISDSKKITQIIENNNSEPVFMITWPYRGSKYKQQEITNSYIKMCEELNVKYIPMGPAWNEVKKWSSDIDLYDDIKHPSKHGTYLNALMLFKFLTNEKTYKKIPRRITSIDKNGQKVYLLLLNHDNSSSLQQLVDNYDFKTNIK